MTKQHKLTIDGVEGTWTPDEEPKNPEFVKDDWVLVFDTSIGYRMVARFSFYREGPSPFYVLDQNGYETKWKYCVHAYHIPGLLHAWRGGENPFKDNPEARVLCMFRDGTADAGLASEWSWEHTKDFKDYNIVQFVLLPDESK